MTGNEKEVLHASLNRHRDAVLWKLEGVGDTDLRRPMTPSGTNLLGLVKHLTAVEYGWFSETFGRPTEPLPFDENDENADLRVTEDETTSDILAFYARARAASDRVIGELDLDDTGTACTEYVAHVMHRNNADRNMHEEMGFYDGWGTVTKQLAELAEQQA